MSWRCSRRRKGFVPYLEGGLPPRAAARLERHLAHCRQCGELLARLRAGHETGRQFGRMGREIGQRPPAFEELRARIGPARDERGRPARPAGVFVRALTTPLAVRVLITLVLAQAILLVVTYRRTLWRAGGPAALALVSGQIQDFTPLSITGFSASTKSPVVTEGIVRDVYFDKEERTLHIKLVDVQQKSEPFVICEVRSPAGMAIPREGSRVRVYGMARYDPQPGRGWNEVNPVMTIAVLKR